MRVFSIYAIAIVAILCGHDVTGQGIPLLITQTPTNAATVVSVGPNSRTWLTVADSNGPTYSFGNAGPASGQVVEMYTGMNYWDGQNWVTSDPSFETTDNGFAANRTQHKVHLAADLNVAGAVSVTTRDGIVLNSTPIGIGLFDAASGNFALIATITNSTGVLVDSNKVVYPNAFAGVCANVVYTMKRGAFHQDVVLTGQLDPTAYGFPATTTRIQVVTEFFSAPEPTRKPQLLRQETNSIVRAQMVSPDLNDETLGFGEFVLGAGKAFTASTPTNHSNHAAVGKQFMTGDGRQFLIETVEYRSIQGELQALPPCQPEGTGGTAQLQKVKPAIGYASIPQPPKASATMAKSKTNKNLLAASQIQGVVIDYSAFVGSGMYDDYVFAKDKTYFIAGPAYFNGNVTFEGGCVLKYALCDTSSVDNATIQLNNSFNIVAGAYQPVIFTGIDDNSVGTSLAFLVSTGYAYSGDVTGNFYGAPALTVNCSYSGTYNNLRFFHAYEAISFDYVTTNMTVINSQFFYCQTGFDLQNASDVTVVLNNCLLADVGNPLANGTNDTYYINNCTFDGVGLLDSEPYANILFITNSIFCNDSDDWTVYYIYAENNGFYNATSFGAGATYTTSTSPFQPTGNASYYLSSGGAFSGVGVTSIDSALLAALRQKTTHSALIYVGTNFSNSLTLTPAIARDTNASAVDLGYHYDPIDYAFSGVLVSNATLTVSGGTVIAGFSTNGRAYGMMIGSGGQFICVGKPTLLNHIVNFNTVQEQSIANWSTPTNALLLPNTTANSPASFIFCRFTDFAIPATDTAHVFNTNGNTSPINFQDCQFHGGTIYSTNATINLTNCLLERVSATLWSGDGGVPHIGNNLFWFGKVDLNFASSSGVVQNNLFDQTSILDHGITGYIGTYNAYLINSNHLTYTNGNDVFLSTPLAYQTGPLGSYYQPTNSPLIDKGSTISYVLGLYHYTVKTNQIKEGVTTVDIGFHYIALAPNGLPDDANGDGIPDYIADANGDGEYDSGDVANWEPLTVVAWGDNTYGQCDVPPGLSNVVAVSGGLDFSLALNSDGTVVAWGDNTYGQTNVPSTATNIVAISANWHGALALKADGASIHWGAFTNDAPPIATNLIAISKGYDYGFALKSDGSLLAWGQPTFRTNLISVSNVVAIAAALDHKVTLSANGTVAAWGDNTFGETNVPSDLTNAVAIAAAYFHSLAIKRNGTVEAWGYNDSGQTDVPTGLSNVVVVAAGEGHSMALKNDGTVSVWGDFGLAGQVFVPQGLTSVIGIGSGANHCLAIRSASLPPVVIGEPTPASITILLGGSASFSVQAQGPSALTYQWQLNGANIVGATGSTLTITNAILAQAGNYDVVISDAAGPITSSNAVLTVNQLPSTTPGAVVPWGETNFVLNLDPVALSNCMAVACGQAHDLVLQENGTVVQWGDYFSNVGGYVPMGAAPAYSNLVAISAGIDHDIGLRTDGGVVTWGLSNAPANFVPTGLPGVTAIAAGWNHNVALLTNGTVTAWGINGGVFGWNLLQIPPDLTNGTTTVTAIAAGALHSLALRSDSTVEGWGYSPDGETNVPPGLSNVVAIAAGEMHSMALKSDGTVIAWGDNSFGQTNVPAGLSNVISIAAGSAHSVALKNDGTIVAWGDNSEGQTNVPAGLGGIKSIAVGGDHNLALVFSPRIQYYPIDVSKDMLLIYNTNSNAVDSATVLNYYLANRPGVSNANVLGIDFPGLNVSGTYWFETIAPTNFTNEILVPVENWLANNPTKRPQYVVLFLDIPSRVNLCATNASNSPFYCADVPPIQYGYPSVSYQLATAFTNWQPFITHINMNGTNDCIAYINKLKNFDTNNSLIISARAGGYSNTNYVLDNVRHGTGYGLSNTLDQDFSTSGGVIASATNGLLAAGVASNAIIYNDGLDTINFIGGTTNFVYAPQITNSVNVAGYASWGAHSALGANFPLDGDVQWNGNSSWWIISTIESFNGQQHQNDQSSFISWFSANAFGGTNYSNVPVGAVTHADEPGFIDIENESLYFGFWASGKVFAIGAWNSRRTIYIQAIGDPFVAH